MKQFKDRITQLYKKKEKIFGIAVFALLLFQIPSPNVYFQDVLKNQTTVVNAEIALPTPPPYPKNTSGLQAPTVSALGVYIVDIPSNGTIYGKNIQERFMPASTTKIATALVALDHFKLEDELVVKTVITEGRVMGLHTSEKITFESLLFGALVHSANDAAFTIAENYPGGVEQFISMMNKKASDLHLANTHFTNPIGFDDPKHLTTASDLARLSVVAMKNKLFSKMVGTKSITVADITYTYFHELKNVNELLGKISGVTGVKTGFTQNAGEILVSEVQKNGRNILFVVLKSQDRFGDTAQLIEWVFANFTWESIDETTQDNYSQLLAYRL